MSVLSDLGGPISTAVPATARPSADRHGWTILVADDAARAAHDALRTEVFVHQQGLFARHDRDEVDDDPRTTVLVARTPEGDVLGGVRLAPRHRGPDLGWWAGSRLVVRRGASPGVGSALVRAACAWVAEAGALRFDALVQADKAVLFRRLGWQEVGRRDAHGIPHADMRWPLDRIARTAQGKAPLAGLVGSLVDAGPAGFRGDDGSPVPGSDLVAACDAILPSMVERDPWWAGWCAVLVNVGDLAAMGATPTGLLDALGAPTESLARRVISGLQAAATAWGVPVLGGHTQLGVPAALSVTALGHTERPVPGGGARPGMVLSLAADVTGGWRPGYGGRQWDSTSHRDAAVLRAQQRLVGDLQPAAAKDVSMAGLVGTVGMMAEASGCGATVDVGRVPRPQGAGMADWLTCFPGFAMVLADHEPHRSAPPLADLAVAPMGQLDPQPGVRLRWPDGEVTTVLQGPVTGLGPAVPTPIPTTGGSHA